MTNAVLLGASLALGAALAQAPSPSPVGVVPLGVTVVEMHAVVAGWSAKKDILGKQVRNDHNEDLGRIEDLVITPGNVASFAIIGVGGFLGIGERRIAIPMRQLKPANGNFELPGATKDAVRAMPPFIYSH